jgi:predicted transposase YdaD
VYRFAQLSREDVEAMLDITLQETRVYQDAKAEGEAKGEAKGAFTLVKSLLRRQLGEIPETTSEIVRKLSIDQLEQLALDLSSSSRSLTLLTGSIPFGARKRYRP